MRLLVVTNDFPPTVGGIENYTYSLVRRWPPGEVVVVTRRVPGCDEFDEAQQFEIRRHDAGTLLPTPSLLGSLKDLVASRGIDAVHFPSALPLGLLGAQLGKPYALSVHGGEFRLASRLPVVRELLRRVCRGAGLIMPESTFASGLVREFLEDPPPIVRVTCGVDIDRYGTHVAPAGGIPEDRRVIVCVTRLVARKGPRTLVGCFPRVKRAFPDAHLLIVGGGPDLEKLKARAQALGIAESVTFAGPQPWERIPSYYAAGYIFALPTRARFGGTETEGLPLVFVEAAAAGLPLVGGDVGGVRDAVREGETGFLVDGSDLEQTAAAVVRLLEEPEVARRMGRRARRMVEEEFTWDSVSEIYRTSMLRHCR